MKTNWVTLSFIFASFFGVGCAEKTSSSPPPELGDRTGLDDTGTGEFDSDGDDDSDGDGDDDSGDGSSLATIPDPGEEYAPLRWYDDGGYHGTPETAQVMGIVLDVPDYIQGGIDPETGNHYFVFRTFEDQTEFYVDLFDKTSEIEYVHIHDGTGLVFGDEIEPKSVSSSVTAEWELEGDTVYVMEVHSPTGGFF